MARPKAKVPIYPRPVSPLHAESYHFDLQDVIYADSCPSSDEDDGARAAKRRRIEKLGEKYLRGDGVHILSAGLKGPFHNGWKNPWSTRQRHDRRVVAEIPETSTKPVKPVQTSVINHTKARSSKVEEWLRRNGAYSNIDVAEQSSPTPKRTQAANLNVDALAPLDVQGQKIELHGPPLRLDTNHNTSQATTFQELGRHDVRAAPRPTSFQNLPAAQVPAFQNDPIERRVWVSHTTNADRAEFAALKSKNRNLQFASPAMMLSPFEYRRVDGEVQKPSSFENFADRSQDRTESMAPPTKKDSGIATTDSVVKLPNPPDTSDVESGYINNGKKGAISPRTTTTSVSVVAPALSTETSRASIANLPSAQPQSLAAPSINDAAIGEEIPEQAVEPAKSIQGPERGNEVRDGITQPTTKQTDNSGSSAVTKDIITPRMENKVATEGGENEPPVNVAKEILTLDTQEMLAAISPLDFSTIKKAPPRSRAQATPVSIAKQRPEERVKRISFAQGEPVSTGSSQSSLKTSLKVSKGPSFAAADKENISGKVGDEEPDTHSAELFSGRSNHSRTPTSSPFRLKSALKPSGLSLSMAPLPSTKGSTSTGIDGGQNAIVKDNGFDLDGAIDDLGSYLGTWDADKEAIGM